MLRVQAGCARRSGSSRAPAGCTRPGCSPPRAPCCSPRSPRRLRSRWSLPSSPAWPGSGSCAAPRWTSTPGRTGCRLGHGRCAPAARVPL